MTAAQLVAPQFRQRFRRVFVRFPFKNSHDFKTGHRQERRFWSRGLRKR